MGGNTSWKHPLKEERLQIGEGDGGEKAVSLVTGGQSAYGDRKGQAGSADGKEVGNKLFLDGVRLNCEGP